MSKDKKLVFGILALLVSIVAVSISYAAFTQNLNINGTGKVQATSWSVHFANLSNAITSGTANETTAPTIKSGRTDIGDYAVSFYTPGDSITYTFDVVNDGDYDAKISVLTKGTPTCNGTDSTSNTNVCANLEYTLKYTSGGANVAVNDTLRKNETKNMTLVLRYKSTIGQNELPTAEVTVSGLGITIQYAQDSLAGGNPVVNPITYINRQNTGQITAGDEIAIDTEHFYVVSSDSTNTVLLAKYNLLVGDVFDVSDPGPHESYILNKTLSPSDTGYGLQSSTAKGYDDSSQQYIGVVPFSGTAYWDDGAGNLLSGYTGSYSGNPYPNVYRSNMSIVAPLIDYTSNLAQNNGYTIAFYVEEYVNTLKGLGAPDTMIGRLLNQEEAQSFASSTNGIVYNGTSYWLSSVSSGGYVFSIKPHMSGGITFKLASGYGVRPVIVISTSDI